MKNNKAVKKAFGVFESMCNNVPAYKKFLQKNGVNARAILKENKFESIPIMDKKSYLLAYNWFDLLPKGKIPQMISASSGSSGSPYFWPRGLDQESWGGEMHQFIFEKIFGFKKKKVLAVICFSMGNWIAGTFTLASLKEVAKKSTQFDLSIITPGIDKEDAIAVLKNFATRFDSVVLIGYPPFIMDIVIGIKEEKLDLRSFDLYFLLAGENFSEKWRDMLLQVGQVPKELNRVVSIYGTADAGCIGHENPFTINLRKIMLRNKAFKKELVGDINFLPTVVSYYPEQTYFENVGGELVFTTNSGIPLTRYNIKDRGVLLEVDKVKSLLKKYKLERLMSPSMYKFKNPLVVLGGRSDVSATFYALNLYPENFKAGLEDDKVNSFVTGKYIVFTEHTKDLKEQRLKIKVELKKDVKFNKNLVQLIRTALFDHLMDLNTEYRKLFNSIREKALPEVELFEYGHKDFAPTKAKHKWVKKGL